jgi:hypothetical protein
MTRRKKEYNLIGFRTELHVDIGYENVERNRNELVFCNLTSFNPVVTTSIRECN